MGGSHNAVVKASTWEQDIVQIQTLSLTGGEMFVAKFLRLLRGPSNGLFFMNYGHV